MGMKRKRPRRSIVSKSPSKTKAKNLEATSIHTPVALAKKVGRPETLPEPDGFPIVGIGTSAGGLEALEEFFRHMPPDSGMAFVVVSHQPTGRTSLLPSLLGQCTGMQLREATDRNKV